jgi:hypothetical protein
MSDTDTATTQSTARPKLALALAKAQGQMANAAKDTRNPFFNSKYADLASVWDACRKPLADNELAVVQLPVGADAAHVAIETLLLHSSGESISSVVVVPISATGKDGKPVAINAQHVGSAITYARRYGLSAMVGIAPEDDDGNTASGRDAAPTRPQPRSATPPTRPQPRSATPPPISAMTDYDAKGAPLASEYGKLEVAVAEAQDEAALTALVERISKLSALDIATIRRSWGARRDEIKASKPAGRVPGMEG